MKWLPATLFQDPQKAEKEKISALFEKYNEALLQDNGEEAVNYVDSRTLKYYSEALEKVIHADRAAIEAMSFLDKLMVLIIRHKATREEILSFTGRSLFVYAVDEGMAGKNSIPNNSLGRIKVVGDFANARALSRGRRTPVHYHFYKEDGEWKIDLTSVFPVSGLAFKKLVEKSGQEENAFLFMLLEMVTGKKPGEEIWEKIA
ncbi:MAG: hypothetical protein IPL49_09290 [Saprospirales bacterium]|nr:hypothetical protein [Saprospirales bacterium]